MLAIGSVRVVFTLLMTFLALKVMHIAAETIAPAGVPPWSKESIEDEQSLDSLNLINERQKACMEVYPWQLKSATTIDDDIKNCVYDANQKWNKLLNHLLLALNKLNDDYHTKISNAFEEHQRNPSMKVMMVHSESFGGNGQYIYKQMEKVNDVIRFWTESASSCISQRLDETVKTVAETKSWIQECIASNSSIERLLSPGISSGLNEIVAIDAPSIFNDSYQSGRKTYRPLASRLFNGFNDTAAVIESKLHGSDGLDNKLSFMKILVNRTALNGDYSKSSNFSKYEYSQDNPQTIVTEDSSVAFNDTYQGKVKTYKLPPQTPRPFYGFNDTAPVISNVAFHDPNKVGDGWSFIESIYNRTGQDSNHSPTSNSNKHKDLQDAAKTNINGDFSVNFSDIYKDLGKAFKSYLLAPKKLRLYSNQRKLVSKGRKRSVRQTFRPTKRRPTSHHIINQGN